MTVFDNRMFLKKVVFLPKQLFLEKYEIQMDKIVPVVAGNSGDKCGD